MNVFDTFLRMSCVSTPKHTHNSFSCTCAVGFGFRYTLMAHFNKLHRVSGLDFPTARSDRRKQRCFWRSELGSHVTVCRESDRNVSCVVGVMMAAVFHLQGSVLFC